MKNKHFGSDNVFSDDGIFSVRERTYLEAGEKCSHCGYELLCGENAVALNNGDLIHEACWCDYADENLDYFGKKFVYSDGSEVTM